MDEDVECEDKMTERDGKERRNKERNSHYKENDMIKMFSQFMILNKYLHEVKYQKKIMCLLVSAVFV